MRLNKIEELLSDRWKAAHPQTVQEYPEQEPQDKSDMAIVQVAYYRESLTNPKGISKPEFRKPPQGKGPRNVQGSYGHC